MSDSFSKSWHNKAYERLQKIQDAIEEKDTEDQRLLDEEEVEHGNVDDRDDNLEDYPSDLDAESESTFRNVDFRTLDQRLDDAVNYENLDFHIQSEGMMTDNDLPEDTHRSAPELAQAPSTIPSTLQSALNNPSSSESRNESLEPQCIQAPPTHNSSTRAALNTSRNLEVYGESHELQPARALSSESTSHDTNNNLQEDKNPASQSTGSTRLSQTPAKNASPRAANSENEDTERLNAAIIASSSEEEEELFDFDGAYFYNDRDAFLQEALHYLRRHPEVRGARLKEFREELLDRSKHIANLDELEKLLQ